MSTTTAPATAGAPNGPRTHQIHECDYCEVHYPECYGYSEQGCTRKCHWRYEARKLLWGLGYDHRYCASCFRHLKDVYPPGRNPWSKEYKKGNPPPQCAIGRAYPTDRTLRGLKEDRKLTRDEDGQWSFGQAGTISERVVCECGVTHHTTVWRPGELSKRQAVSHGSRLLDALDARRKRSQCEFDLHRDAFFRYLKKHKSKPEAQGTPDHEVFEHALGFGLWWSQRPEERPV